MAYLIFQMGGGNHVDYEVPARPLTIGRSPEADLQIGDEKISRLHCGIRAEGDVFIIKDFGSTNGTFVNDQKIHESNLKFGDTIRIGHTMLLFQAEARKHATARIPEVIEVELPDQPFSKAMQQLADEATRASQRPPISPSAQ
jgi:pSer/pThr/pTyr-binding forkhead associated (FHA) protein